MQKVVYPSNGATVGDGKRIAEVSNNGQTLEFMVDMKTGRMSPVKLVDNAPAPTGVQVVDEADLLAKLAVGPKGTTFILAAGLYRAPADICVDFLFYAASGKPIDFQLSWN